MEKPPALIIDYYSDILCVWAWIAQRRIDELNQKLGDQIELRYYYVDIFGDVANKMKASKQSNDPYESFAKHVQSSASNYEHAPINPDIWTVTRPTTSANAHMVLKAVELITDNKTSAALSLKIRNAFYVDAKDISNLELLYNLVASNGLDVNATKDVIENGKALAALMNDYQKTKQQNIKGSPSYVMDGGRQVLFGNVGYRILKANIEELIKRPDNEASWC